MSFARRTAAVVQQCSRKQPRQPRRRSEEIETSRRGSNGAAPSLDHVRGPRHDRILAGISTSLRPADEHEAEISALLRSDLERRSRAEAEVAPRCTALEGSVRRCDADLDEERAAAREALLAVELVEPES